MYRRKRRETVCHHSGNHFSPGDTLRSRAGRVSDDADDGIEDLACLGKDDAESVLSLAVDGSFLYSGKLEGVIELWDLDTTQKLRVTVSSGSITPLGGAQLSLVRLEPAVMIAGCGVETH